jgi:hypothetical protein
VCVVSLKIQEATNKDLIYETNDEIPRRQHPPWLLMLIFMFKTSPRVFSATAAVVIVVVIELS